MTSTTKIIARQLLLWIPLLPLIWVLAYATGITEEIFNPSAFGLMGIASLASMIVYAISIFKNSSLSSNERFILLFGLIAFSTPTQVYYWAVYRKYLV